MTGAPGTALESRTHRGFIREERAYRGGTALTTPSVLGQGAFLQEEAMDIGQRALDYHNNGFNCAQSVFAACCEYTGMDEKTALALSAGFGGGARSGELCGAITGAVMAEGLTFPFNDGQDIEAKDKIAAIAKQCVGIAREKYGHVRCEELKGNIDCMEIIAFMAETAEYIMKKEKY